MFLFETVQIFETDPDYANLSTPLHFQQQQHHHQQQQQQQQQHASTSPPSHEYVNHRCNHAHVRYAHSNTQTHNSSCTAAAGSIPLNNLAQTPHASSNNGLDDDEDDVVGWNGNNIKSSAAMAETVLMGVRASRADSLRHMSGGAQQMGGDDASNLLNFGAMRDRVSERYERVDGIATWLFPLFFFLFNMAYWSYYLLLNDIINELW
jgi:hypothetical protein